MDSQHLHSIMLVDDSPDIREIAKISLEQVGGFTVHSCDGAESALEMAKTVTPDLVVLDVMMPGTDGPTLLKALKNIERFAKTPVLFLTGKEDYEGVDEFKSLGVIGVIKKPFNPVSLPQSIRESWESA